ncbi:hypothetical protein QTG54_000872 [Skeletonema marinoi]|uniref:PRA1 family protein n=1 Tax=Skeletonema marinoi TaxID=267567 RepID=A0AAD9DKP5_9STRA|nr:hypothetical protein QTG54_000872 [Skeletonema marinoi]
MALTDDSTTSSTNSGGIASTLTALNSASSNIKNAWDKSGGSQALSSIQSSLPQGTKDYIADAQNKVFNRKNLRSPTVFFGLGEEKPFYLERVPSLVTERVKHNLSFFYLNYALLTALLFALTLLISPSAIIGIGLLGVCLDGRITVTQKQATIAMSGFSVIVLIWLLAHIFWWTLSTSGFLTGVHCLLRDASMHKDEEDRVEMQGDLSLDEEATFLNSGPDPAGSMA